MSIKVLALVCSNSIERSIACYNSWGKSFESSGGFFVAGNQKLSNALPYAFNAVGMSREERRNLPAKMLKAFELLVKKEWDFIIKADDDTFVNIEELIQNLNTVKKEHFYSGFLMNLNGLSYAQGGAGYVLSKRTLETILPRFKELCISERFGKHYAEDVLVGKSCEDMKIKFSSNYKFWTPRKIAEMNSDLAIANIKIKKKITSHYLDAKDLNVIKEGLKSFRDLNILFGIYSYKGSNDCLQACLDTWVKDIPDFCDYRIIGDKFQQDQFGEKVLACSPKRAGRATLPQKTVNMLKKILDIPNWEYFFKCDDDTFVHVAYLIAYIEQQKFRNQNVYMGWPLRKGKISYAQGGSGYLLSRDVVVKIVDACEKLRKSPVIHRSEDLMVGIACAQNKIPLRKATKFGSPQPFNAKLKNDAWILNYEKVLTHYVSASDMRRWWKERKI